MEKSIEALSREVAQMQETIEMLIGYIEADGTKVAIDDATVRFDHSKTDMSAEKTGYWRCHDKPVHIAWDGRVAAPRLG